MESGLAFWLAFWRRCPPPRPYGYYRRRPFWFLHEQEPPYWSPTSLNPEP